MEEKINSLYSIDNVTTYHTLLELEILSTESDGVYQFFDKLLDMLKSDKSFVRVRGFRLICSVAKYDKENKINKNIDLILNELDDPIGTSIRQCLSKINLILMFKLELTDKIELKLNNFDLTKYKESMQPLIKKDIENILKNI